MAPGWSKNVVDTGNPVYPLGYKVFGGRHWDPARDAKWSAAHGPRPIEPTAFVRSVVDVAGRSDWQSPLYAALAPLAFLRPGLASGRAGSLAVYVGLSVPDLVAPDAPARPLLAADPAARWRSWRASGRTGRGRRAWTVLAGGRRWPSAIVIEPRLLARRPWRA